MDNEFLNNLLNQIMSRFDKLDKTLDRMIRTKQVIDVDTLLDNQDMCILLGVTKRTLATYRQRKYINFYRIDRKTYYKASEVEGFLQSKGKSL